MLRNLIILAFFVLSAKNTFSQDLRIVSRHRSQFGNGTWPPQDSTRYIYLTSYGGDLDDMNAATMKYDTAHTMEWDGSNYEHTRTYIQTLNSQGWIMDEVSQAINGNNHYKALFVRDGNGNATEETHQGWNNNTWVNQFLFLRTYDNDNNLLWEERQQWVSNAWQPMSVFLYQYDMNSAMTRSVTADYNFNTSQFDSSYLSINFNNSNGQPDSVHYSQWNGVWEAYGKLFYTYDVNDIAIYILQQSWLSNQWQNTNEYHTYTTNNIVTGDSSRIWDQANNMWLPHRKGEVTLDGNDRRVLHHSMLWSIANNQYEESWLDSTEYNTDGVVSRRKFLTWNNGMQQWGTSTNYEHRYYYEAYTTVNNINKPTVGLLAVYPTVAQGNINVSMKWNEAQDFKVVIYDMQGRLVRQWGEKATKDYNKNIPVTELASGTYIIQLKGKNALVQEQFIITN